MKCYYHHNHPAVGICKNCQRGICTSCAAEVGQSIACKASCQKQVADVDAMISRNIVAVKTEGKTNVYIAVYLFLVGLVALVASYINSARFDLMALVGVVFVFMGVLQVVFHLKLARGIEPKL